MTPQELHAALDAARGRTPWWQVAYELDVSENAIRAMRRGVPSPRVAERAPAWLEGRRQASPWKE